MNIQHIDMGDVLDISSSAELKNNLLQALNGPGNIVLDASQIERADTSALQVLMAFVHDARVQDKGVSWHQPSEALIRSAAYIGLQDKLGLPDPTS